MSTQPRAGRQPAGHRWNPSVGLRIGGAVQQRAGQPGRLFWSIRQSCEPISTPPVLWTRGTGQSQECVIASVRPQKFTIGVNVHGG